MLAVLGFLLSFLGSVPMTGPLAALVLERALGGERKSATLIAAGGCVVEGSIAAVLASFVPQLLEHSGSVVRIARLLGAAVILLVGVALVAFPRLLGGIDTERSTASARAGVLATALNPTLVATWTVVVTSLHGERLLSGGLAEGLGFGLGVALGSLAWFGLVVLGVGRIEQRGVSRHRDLWMRGVGLLLAIAGTVLLARTLVDWKA